MIVPRKSAAANSEFNSPQFDEEFDLSKLWLCVVRHKAIVVFGVLLGALVGMGEGFHQTETTPFFYASSKVAPQVNAGIGSVGGVGAEPIAKEMTPWRENEEIKKSLEKSLSYPVLSKWLSSFGLEVLNGPDLEKADLRVPIVLSRQVQVKNSEGLNSALKFSIKYTGRQNELPAMIQVDASRRELASRFLEAWAVGVNADLEQKRMPLIENATRVASELKVAYEKLPSTQLRMRASFAEMNRGMAVGIPEPPKSAFPLSFGGLLEVDPKVESVETALRILGVMKQLPVIQPPILVLDKGTLGLKRMVTGGLIGAFLGLGLLGGFFLLQILRSDRIETERELATIFPESAVLKIERTHTLKDASKTVLWAAWVHAGADKPGASRDFVLWQTGRGEIEALSEVLIQEYRAHYAGTEIYRAANPSEAEARRTLKAESLSTPASLKLVLESVSAESLMKVHSSEKIALVINERAPSLAEWKQNAAALEFSGVRPQLVILLS